MNPSPVNKPQTGGARAAGFLNRRLLILAPVLVLLGAALAGLWFKYGRLITGHGLAGPADIQLSSNTVDLLRRLNSPVEIRFYSVLPPGTAPASLQEFSGRVDRLLSGFQNANGGQIHVTRNISTSGAGADAASADGIRPFNLEKGDACFLGIAVASGTQKEFLPQIQPEWEPALEFDLARAILHVTTASTPVAARPAAPISPEITNAITRLIPDVKSTSLEEGTRILREEAFKEFTAAGAEMEEQIKTAQQQLSDAQNGQSEAVQQAAMKHLQQVQLEQGEKYKQIAAQLQIQLDVFSQMKAADSATK